MMDAWMPRIFIDTNHEWLILPFHRVKRNKPERKRKKHIYQAGGLEHATRIQIMHTDIWRSKSGFRFSLAPCCQNVRRTIAALAASAIAVISRYRSLVSQADSDSRLVWVTSVLARHRYNTLVTNVRTIRHVLAENRLDELLHVGETLLDVRERLLYLRETTRSQRDCPISAKTA